MTYPLRLLDHMDDRRRHSSEYLRQADQLVKAKKYEAALQVVVNAKKIDPNNLYAEAYEDRVRSLIGRSLGTSATPVNATAEVVKHFLQKADYYLSEGRFEKALEETANAFTINPQDSSVETMKNTIIDAIKREHDNQSFVNAPSLHTSQK
ncbi:MAG TPA: hypothetical protein VGB89_09375 [Bacteroidota bacterium]